jgi:D-alanine--poly(phosphoribitol) ligase subunit 1
MSNESQYLNNLGLIFYHTVEMFSCNSALRYPAGENISYAELNSRSNKVARFFLQNGIIKGDVVAIFNDKSSDAFVSILACIKIGAVYTNIDHQNPISRIDKMLNSCKPKLILNFFPELRDTFYKLIQQGWAVFSAYQDKLKSKVQLFKEHNLTQTSSISGSDPIYIVFTSGSTGFPKGALMSHDNVKHFVQWSQATFNITPNDRLTNVNPIYFDNSVFDIYSSLFTGASLSPITETIVSIPHKLVSVLEELKCSIWFSVPSLLVYLLTTKSLNNSALPSIQKIIFGGEGFPKANLKKLFDLLGHRTELVNVYGPTECTCICSSYVISESDFNNMQALPPLGQISTNFSYLILDNNEQQSTKGELCLIGPCVGMGYYNENKLTLSAFTSLPKSKNTGDVMYRTGDLVEEKNHSLHFLGRKDNQIKHMGYRIELEEIESVINSLDEVSQCVVVYITHELYAGKISAAVVLNTKISLEALKKLIDSKLPDYMRPKELNLLSQLPKNRNGKVDRSRLKLRYSDL